MLAWSYGTELSEEGLKKGHIMMSRGAVKEYFGICAIFMVLETT